MVRQECFTASIIIKKKLRHQETAEKRRSHMRKLEEVFSETKELYGRIDRLLKLSAYDQYDDLSGLDINYKDGEQLFLLEEMQAIMKSLDDVRRRIKYLSLPVREVSRLHRNESGRYETDRGHYYTSGSPIEALIQDGYREVPYWVWTYVEHNCRDYYLVGYGDLNIEDLTVRVRGEG